MCSNVAGLMNGPVGNLVAIGVKALIEVASPIGPRSANSLGRPTESENVHKFYNVVEAHLHGTLRVLQPALEIKNILIGECKSAGNPRSAPINGTPIAYYTPQHAKKSSRSSNFCDSRNCEPAKKSAGKSVNPRNDSHSSSRGTRRNSSPQRNGKCGSVDKSRKECCRKDTSKALFSTPRDHSAKSEGTARERTTKNKTSGRSVKMCQVCKVDSMDNSVLVALPCKHVFCYPCLAEGKYPRCRKCEKSFDMKNVTNV